MVVDMTASRIARLLAVSFSLTTTLLLIFSGHHYFRQSESAAGNKLTFYGFFYNTAAENKHKCM
jgi:hypothetical protein